MCRVGMLASYPSEVSDLPKRDCQSGNYTLVLSFCIHAAMRRVFQPWTLQTTVPFVALARLWLAVPTCTGPDVTTLSEGLRTILDLVCMTRLLSHSGHSFPGSLSGTLYLCASWRTRWMVVNNNDGGGVDADGRRKDFADADDRGVEAALIDGLDAFDLVFGIKQHRA